MKFYEIQTRYAKVDSSFWDLVRHYDQKIAQIEACEDEGSPPYMVLTILEEEKSEKFRKATGVKYDVWEKKFIYCECSL